MSINLRAACVTAAKQAVKEYDISAIIALGKEEPDIQDIEKIKEICKKYAPDWQELFALNRKDLIDESLISCLDEYFLLSWQYYPMQYKILRDTLKPSRQPTI